MPSTKRERENARRRQVRRTSRETQREAAHRRRRLTILATVGGLVLVATAVALVLQLTARGTDPASAGAAPTEVPDPALAEGRTWTAELATTAGDLTLELDGAAAPQAVASFLALADAGYFDDTTCHRLTTEGIYVLQCGDPTGTGTGGPEYRFGPIENAPADDVYPAGTVAMARVGGDASSMGSQFFLVYEDSTIPSDSAGGYTVLGQIIEGMDVLQEVADAGIAEGTAQTPATTVTIEGVETQ